MTIKRFELYYGSYFGFKEEIMCRNHQLLYRCGEYFPDKEIAIEPDNANWKRFFSSIEPLVKNWKRYYNAMVCDGLEWSVDIETDELKIVSSG